MADNTEGLVALFIDWDNLAISVAADLGGATPDLKRIVQTAQTFGKVVIARAYAEWNATSERLSVYRAGVEPVYAPTFRFEPDPLTQGARGKSLADPIMVADAIDILHLLPNITTYVIVSGDKDLIPVVRLAQLRGKYVAVIGPDYAAGVLRDICDEFISYRSVIGEENGRPVEAGGRRPQPSRRPEPSSAQRGRRQPAMPSSPARGRPREASPIAEPVEPAFATAPSIAEASKAEPAIEATTAREAAPDLTTVYASVVDILKQRTGEGKVRLRATNLKDNLMARLPGFSERKYGYPKFKDFLVAAEKAGVVSVTVAGPVHWVSLPAKPETEIEVATEAAPALSSVTPLPEAQAAAETPDLTALADERFGEIVRFVMDLRGRSRWLTYTYVLTNLISFLGRAVPQVDAESAARSTLTRLVQEGILRIDREPQEVEVGGIRHRVRMCHLEESHPFVADMLAIVEAERQKAAEAAAAPSAEGLVETAPVESIDQATEEVRASEAEVSAEEIQPAVKPATNEAPSQVAMPSAAEKVPAVAANGTLEPHAEPVASERNGQRAHAVEAQGQPSAPVETEGTKSRPPAASPAGLGGTLSLEEAYTAVSKVVRQSATSGKARVRLTGLKAKLTGELGHFDEQVYGFKRFKDFLVAAEKAGRIKLETAGPVVWVTTPDEEATLSTDRGPEPTAESSSATISEVATAEQAVNLEAGTGLSEGTEIEPASQDIESTATVGPEVAAGEEPMTEAKGKSRRSRAPRRRAPSKQSAGTEVLVEQ